MNIVVSTIDELSLASCRVICRRNYPKPTAWRKGGHYFPGDFPWRVKKIYIFHVLFFVRATLSSTRPETMLPLTSFGLHF
jgi:hypothetical protein